MVVALALFACVLSLLPVRGAGKVALAVCGLVWFLLLTGRGH